MLSLMLHCSFWRTLFQPESIIFTLKLNVSGMLHQHRTLARYSPCFKFPSIVSIRQSCNSVVNRVLTYFFPVMLWNKYIHIQLPQGGEMEKKIVEKCKQTTLRIQRRNKASHKAKFHKVHWAGWQTSPPSAQLWKNRHISSAVTSYDFIWTYELIADLRLNFNSHLL